MPIQAANIEPSFETRNPCAPERNLMCAILGHAFLDLKGNRPYANRRQALQFLCQEGDWAAPHYQEYPFLAKNICFALGLDYEVIRIKAIQMYADPDSVDFQW